MIGLIDQGVIALYFLGVLVIGFLASRQVKTSDDFSIAGGRLRFPVLMGTLIGTSIGAAATMGRAGKAAEVGVVILVSGVAYATGLLACWPAPSWRRRSNASEFGRSPKHSISATARAFECSPPVCCWSSSSASSDSS